MRGLSKTMSEISDLLPSSRFIKDFAIKFRITFTGFTPIRLWFVLYGERRFVMNSWKKRPFSLERFYLETRERLGSIPVVSASGPRFFEASHPVKAIIPALSVVRDGGVSWSLRPFSVQAF